MRKARSNSLNALDMLGLVKLVSVDDSNAASNSKAAPTRTKPRRSKSSESGVAPSSRGSRLGNMLNVGNHNSSSEEKVDESKVLADFLRSAERLEQFAKEKAEKEERRARRRKNRSRRSKSSGSCDSTFSSDESPTNKLIQSNGAATITAAASSGDNDSSGRPKIVRRRSFMGLGKLLKNREVDQPRVIELKPLKPFDLPQKKKKEKKKEKVVPPDHYFDDEDDEDELIVDLDDDLDYLQRQIQSEVQNMVIVINHEDDSAKAA